jgi:hypothetical protein
MNLKDLQRPDPGLAEQYRELATCYSGSCVFADVQRREEGTRQQIKRSCTFEQLSQQFGRS